MVQTASPKVSDGTVDKRGSEYHYNPVNDAPVANDMDVEVDEDTPGTLMSRMSITVEDLVYHFS